MTRNSGSKDQAASAGPVSASVVEGGELGTLNEDGALRSRVEPLIAASLTAATAAPKASVVATPCETETRALQPGTEVLVYRGSATWQGTPAVVLGFSPAGAPATSVPGRRASTRVYVLARAGCRLLSFQSYAP